MNLATSCVTILLALGLVLPSVAGASEPIKRSIDDQGTIHIGTDNSARKAKAGEQAGEATAPPRPATRKQAAPAGPPPPGLMPSQARRLRAPEAEARRQAFEKAHPGLVPARSRPPGRRMPVPQAAPQPVQPTASETR
jgi:hypothetical protein